MADVEDCAAVCALLVERGDADPDRLCIRGGSAGGFTTLAALAFHDVFAAGASHYGIADLGVLAEETHKFESRYLDGLVGPWPEARATYEARSPIFHTDRHRPAAGRVPGPRRPDRAAQPGRDDRRRAARQGRAGRLRGLRGRAARLPPGAEHPGGPRRRASFYAQVLGFDLPADEGIPRLNVENL